MRRVPPCLLVLLGCLNGLGSNVVFPPPPVPAGTPPDAFGFPRIDQIQDFLNCIHHARTMPRVDLMLDGDALTFYWQVGDRGGPIYQKLYGPRNVVDFAGPPDGTEQLLWRLQHGELQGLHPKLFMLMIGANDLGTGSPQEIADGVSQGVQACRAQCPDMHILLLGLLPQGNSPADPTRVKIKQVNALLSKLDDGQHVTYLDMGDKYLLPNGTIDRTALPDVLTTKGYQIWADAVQPVIDKYCPPEPAGAATPHTIAEIDASLPTQTWPFAVHPPAGTPIPLFPVPRSNWLWRYAADQEREKQGPYDFVIDGDSITELWQAGGNRGLSVWKKHWANIKVMDDAIAGDRVQHALWRVQNGDVEGLDPKLIMLLIGTNNSGDDPKDVALGVRKMLDEYEQRCPHAHLLLLGIFPRGAKPTDPLRAWVKSVNAILSTYASDPRVTYLDIGDKFLQPDGTITADIMPDFLHPSTKGFEIWADAIQPVIDQYFPGAAAK